MKKYLPLTIALCSVSALVFAQNVGIGTNSPVSRLSVNGGLTIGATFASGSMAAPANGLAVEGSTSIGAATADASAVLDLVSTSKGLSLPNVALNSTSDNTTVTSPKKGLLVYNTGAGTLTQAGLYCNIGTSTTPNWAKIVDGSSGVTSITSGSPLSTNVSATGSVTVNLTGVVGVANGGTGLSAGVSGGIPYYSSSTTIASSGLLVQNGVLVGGGAGAAPTTIATANNGVLATSGAGVPSITITLPAAVQANITGVGTITSGTWNSTNKIALAFGGTGADASALAQNLVFSSPATGTGNATFRALTTGDLPASLSGAWTRTGTNVVLVNITDNVGIGTTPANGKLQISSSTASSNAVYVNYTGTTAGTSWYLNSNYSGIATNSAAIGYSAGLYGWNSGVAVKNTAGVVGAYSAAIYGGLGYVDNNSALWGVYSGGPVSVNHSGDVPFLLLNTASTTDKRTRINFAQNGAIGMEIGTDVGVGNVNDLYLYNRALGIIGGYFQFSASGGAGSIYLSPRGTNTDFNITSSGNVGIGTTPTYKLQVLNTVASNDDPATYSVHAVTPYYAKGVHGEGGWMGVYGIATLSGASFRYGVYGVASGGATNNYGVYGSGSGTGSYGLYSSGNTGASGTKSAIVKTPTGPKLLYSQESPEIWFEDFGSAIITNGEAQVKIASDFAQTITVDQTNPLKVFLTPMAQIGEWWIEKSTTGFTLHAPSASNGAEFDYRIVAKRKGYENLRLVNDPGGYSDTFLYPDISEVPDEYRGERMKMQRANAKMEEKKNQAPQPKFSPEGNQLQKAGAK